MFSVLIFLLFISIHNCLSAKLPPYFSQCSKSDDKLNECVLHNANGGLYAFVKGDKSYNIRSMIPLFISDMSLNLDKNLKLNLKNSVITELDGAKVKDAKLNLTDQHIELSLYVPRATLLGQYNIKGKISILPIDEKGPVNITVVHSRIKYSFDYELNEKKGFHYLNITNSNITYKSERSYFIFYNMFVGNDYLGAIINSALNEHHTETNSALEPALSEALCDITTESVSGFFQKVPLEELMKQ